MRTQCPLCEEFFTPDSQQLEDVGWHEGANPERVAGAIICSDCSKKEAKDGQNLSKETGTCVCDYSNRGEMTMEQWEAAEGHFNQAGGFCCPHHGNTCGHCHQYD